MGRTFGRRTGFLALAVVVALLLAACSSSAAVPDAGRVAGGGAPNPPGSNGKTTTVAGGSSGETTDTAGVLVPDGPQIVRTGSLALEVKDLDASLLKARAAIVGLGGYLSDSARTSQGDSAMALITYRIPASRWDDAIDALHGLATKVVSEDTKSVEVTGQVVDLTARIANLQATERALQAIMAQATKISDILDVQNQLSSVQGQIEELTAQKAHLSDQAAMGTLAVTYSLPVVATTQATSGWNLGAEVDRAVAQLVEVAQAVAVAGLWLAIVGLPIAIGLLIVIGLAGLIVRRTGLLRPRAVAETTLSDGAAG